MVYGFEYWAKNKGWGPKKSKNVWLGTKIAFTLNRRKTYINGLKT